MSDSMIFVDADAHKFEPPTAMQMYACRKRGRTAFGISPGRRGHRVGDLEYHPSRRQRIRHRGDRRIL